MYKKNIKIFINELIEKSLKKEKEVIIRKFLVRKKKN